MRGFHPISFASLLPYILSLFIELVGFSICFFVDLFSRDFSSKDHITYSFIVMPIDAAILLCRSKKSDLNLNTNTNSTSLT